jgi:formamidopyrimidine-DNA glycosylase
MSIEMPEATIVARQLDPAIRGRVVAGFELRGCENFQRIGFMNRDSAAFARLAGLTVTGVDSRGNTMVVRLSDQQSVVVSPEYGGEVLFHENDRSLPARYHFKLDFTDGSALTVWIKTMGGVYATDDAGLAEHYLVRRDFDPSRTEPNDERLTFEVFSDLLAPATRQLKTVLVGKDAVVVGLSNSAFQDIIYRAGLHPKRRASDLSTGERRALYEAMRLVIDERLRLGGKTSFRDIYGVPGGYEPAMGPAFKNRPCPKCGTPIQKLAHGGGEVFVCPGCQPEKGSG